MVESAPASHLCMVYMDPVKKEIKKIEITQDNVLVKSERDLINTNLKSTNLKLMIFFQNER